MKDQLSKFVNKLPNNVNPADALAAIKQIMELKAVIAKSDKEIKELEVIEKISLHEIDRKYDFYHEIFSKIFSERKEAIDKFFHVIDEGIKKSDKDLIASGLNNLANVVSSSPFSNLSELNSLIQSGKTIDL